MTSLDQIGQKAAKLLRGMESDRKLAQPLVDQIFTAFEEAKRRDETMTINGASGKTTWAKQAGVSLRYAQYVRRDGSRKREEKRTTVRVANLDKATHVIVGAVKYKVTGLNLNHFPKCGQIGINIEEPEEKPEPKVKHARTNGGRLSLCEQRMPNKPREKRKVFVADKEDPTCPDCLRIIEAAKARSGKDTDKPTVGLSDDQPALTLVIADQCPTEYEK